MTQLSMYFKLAEATKSSTAQQRGIKNDPSLDHWPAIVRTAMKMDEVRELLKGPVIVNSWYRNPEVNRLVGGVPTSQHAKGEAVDFVCPSFGTPYDICKRIEASGIEYDQLILEPTWVHISFVYGKKPRKQSLTLKKVGGPYLNGIVR